MKLISQMGQDTSSLIFTCLHTIVSMDMENKLSQVFFSCLDKVQEFGSITLKYGRLK